MTVSITRRLLLGAAMALGLAGAAAAEYPERPITLVIPLLPEARPMWWAASSPTA
ncbi:hypothetical protein ACFSS8_21605 [Paracoccus kondratievae]